MYESGLAMTVFLRQGGRQGILFISNLGMEFSFRCVSQNDVIFEIGIETVQLSLHPLTSLLYVS